MKWERDNFLKNSKKEEENISDETTGEKENENIRTYIEENRIVPQSSQKGHTPLEIQFGRDEKICIQRKLFYPVSTFVVLVFILRGILPNPLIKRADRWFCFACGK